MTSAMIEDLLARGGHGDLRYTLNARPVTSLSDSNRPTRSLEGVALESCSSEQRGDGAFGSSSIGTGALIEEFLQRGGHGDLRSTFASRPVTSLSNSNLPTRWLGGFVLERPCSWQQRGAEEQRRRRAEPWERAGSDLLGVSSMAFGVMISNSRFGTTQIPAVAPGGARIVHTTPRGFRCCCRCLT